MMIVKKCKECGREGLKVPFEIERNRSKCRDCRKAYFREYREKNIEEERARDRARYRRQMSDPEQAEARRQYEREAARLRRLDPEYRERQNENHRNMLRRIYRDPSEEERRRRYNEAQALTRRIKRIDAGLPVREAVIEHPVSKNTVRIPYEPLRRIVANSHRTEEEIAAAAGFAARIFYDARNRGTITIQSADRIATFFDLTLELLYDDEDFEQAA